jgi:hypothetical protein
MPRAIGARGATARTRRRPRPRRDTRGEDARVSARRGAHVRTSVSGNRARSALASNTPEAMTMEEMAGTGRTPTTRARKALLARCSALRERRSEAIARGVRRAPVSDRARALRE